MIQPPAGYFRVCAKDFPTFSILIATKEGDRENFYCWIEASGILQEFIYAPAEGETFGDSVGMIAAFAKQQLSVMHKAINQAVHEKSYATLH